MDSKKMNPQKIHDFIINDKNPTKITKRIIELLRTEYPNINTLHRKFGDIRKTFSEEDKKKFHLEYSLLALTQEEISNRENKYKENRDARNDKPTTFTNDEMKGILKIAENILKKAEQHEANEIIAALGLSTGLRMVEICRVSKITFHTEPNKVYIFGLAKKANDTEGTIREEEGKLITNEDVFFNGYKVFVKKYKSTYDQCKDNIDFNNRFHAYIDKGVKVFENEKIKMYKDLRDIYANYTSLTVEEIQENLHHDSIESSLSYKKVNIEKEEKKEEKDIFKDIKLNTREQKELYNKAKEFYLKYNRLPTNGELRDIEFDGKKRGDYRRSKAVIEAMEACLK